MFERFVERRVEEVLADTPVVDRRTAEGVAPTPAWTQMKKSELAARASCRQRPD